MNTFLITAPAEIISVADLKAFARVDHELESALFAELAKMAREFVEKETNSAIGQQTWELYLDKFVDEIELPKPPFISLTHIKYLDLSGNEQTLDASKYRAVRDERARITPAYGCTWPDVLAVNKSITVRFVCGYKIGAVPGNGEVELPSSLSIAMKILTASYYDNRGPVASDDTYTAVKRFCSHAISKRFGYAC